MSTTRTRSSTTLNAGLPALADPEYLEGMQHGRPRASGPSSASASRSFGPSAAGSAPRPAACPRPRAWTSRRASSASRSSSSTGSRTGSSSGRSATSRSAPGSSSAPRAAAAHEWATVDALAHVAALGIVAEPYRWAELEQLVYSPSRWERRLAGSTIATLPFADRVAGRQPEIAVRGLRIVGGPHGRRLAGRPEVALVGDPLPDHRRSPGDGRASCAPRPGPPRATDDGARAWVVRDSLEKLPAPVAAELRAVVDGIRRRPNAASTSRAAETAAAFAGLGVAVPPAERPIIDRTSPLPDRRSTTS